MIEIGGFVGLAALVIGLFAWTRADMRLSRAESKGDVSRLEGGIADLRSELTDFRNSGVARMLTH